MLVNFLLQNYNLQLKYQELLNDRKVAEFFIRNDLNTRKQYSTIFVKLWSKINFRNLH